MLEAEVAADLERCAGLDESEQSPVFSGSLLDR
jgi:hypothetical protein